jgi:hypothetical protein
MTSEANAHARRPAAALAPVLGTQLRKPVMELQGLRGAWALWAVTWPT